MRDADDYDAFFRPATPPARDQGPGPAGPPRRISGRDAFPPPSPPGPRRRWRIPALIGIAVVVIAGGAYLVGQRSPARRPHQSTPTSALSGRPAASPQGAAMLPAGKVGPRSAVPWNLVGPGWALAEYTKTRLPGGAPVPAKPTILYLVDPLGGRYKMYRWPAGQGRAYTLLDWSGDRTRALFSSGSGPIAIHQLKLATGAMTSFTLSAGVNPIRYTRPDGTNLLAVTATGVVERFDLTGVLQARLATGSSVVSSPDGTTLAIGARTGIELVSNAGGSPQRFKLPVSSVGCVPVRWWNAGTVLATCLPVGSGAAQLWLVPTDGARPTALTPVRAAGPDYGDVDAWKLSSGLYLQADGAGCGLFVARQAPSGSAIPVNGQGNGGVNTVLAVVGSRMLVRAGAGCPSSGSLIWLDPAAGTSQTLLTAPFSERGVTKAIAYTGPNR